MFEDWFVPLGTTNLRQSRFVLFRQMLTQAQVLAKKLKQPNQSKFH
jgi:hypothetical protein